jgi:hypothetical protein
MFSLVGRLPSAPSANGFLRLSTLPDKWIDAPENSSQPIADRVTETVLWPIAVCVYLSGPGVPIGPPENTGTKQLLFSSLPSSSASDSRGIFYSSLVFLVLWWRRKHTNRTTG